MTYDESAHAENVRTWITAYVRAWETNDADAIGDLFTDDATYRTAPFREPRLGRDEIVSGWLADRDAPGEWTFEWIPLVSSGDLATIVGETRYADGRSYSNLWVMRFTPDGRAREYTEWFMEQPSATEGD